jgi:hypothetical protein
MKTSFEGHLEIVGMLLQQPNIDVNAQADVSDDMINTLLDLQKEKYLLYAGIFSRPSPVVNAVVE